METCQKVVGPGIGDRSSPHGFETLGFQRLIADNFTQHHHFFIGRSRLWKTQKVNPRAIRVRVAKHFTRLLFALVAGRQLLRHPCLASRESMLRKLLKFLRSSEAAGSGDPHRARLPPPANGRICPKVWFPRTTRSFVVRIRRYTLQRIV